MNTAARPVPFLNTLKQIFGFATEIDWWLLAATGFLVFIGLNTLRFSEQTVGYYEKQLDFFWAGLVLLAILSRIPNQFWTNKYTVPLMYLGNLGLLVAVMLKGHTAQGAQRWLAIGPITLQPSEIAKLVVIFTLAAWLGRRPIRSFFDIFKLIAIILPPAVLVFKQPDLGTSLTFGAVFFGMAFWAGATVCDVLALVSPLFSLILNAIDQTWWIYYIGAVGVILAIFWRSKDWSVWIRLLMVLIIVAGNYGVGMARPHMWGLLKEYQQKRLTSFVNPYEDPRGSGYHILQSLIAIGSGGIQGAGLGKGNQSQGAFIPERHTDFIFAVVGEEWGFKIAAVIIFAYGIICTRALIIANQSRGDPTASVMAIGLMCMFLFHVFLNIGMTMGIMPVAGVPLPFLSYGGTALIVDLSSIGLLLAIRRQNPPQKKEEWK
ncbi:MAG TPA: rod shape-determining protein RodA [Candidatus Obscuribacterales bacterium]